MKNNRNVTITGRSVILVPYRQEHVSWYHAWMQDPKLQEATASEPLTLQASLSPCPDFSTTSSVKSALQEEYDMQLSWCEDADSMVGDVNLYLNDADEPNTGEIEIMVAEKNSRRKGVAYEALTLFMAYSVKHLGINCFQAKIGLSNAASLKLFQRLGYVETSSSQVFNEATLRLEVSGTVSEALQQQAEKLQLGTYDHS